MQSAPDRRKEKRRPAQGPVSIFFEDPLPRHVTGRLVDISESGFRSTHDDPALHSGQEVRFEHPSAKGRARIMWTRIAPPHIEAGFLVLRREATETP